MKVALVHDWLIHMRGGEKVLEALAEVFPDATIYTLFTNRKSLSPSLQRMKIKTSFLQWLPGIWLYYRWLLPFLPSIIQTLRVGDCELVISSSHCVAKGIRIPDGVYHICYCHTPMRYLWGFEEEYFGNFPKWLRTVLKPVFDWLRRWDVATSRQVNLFFCNSEYVRIRIQKIYGRDAEVIPPPVDAHAFEWDFSLGDKKNYYLIVSALTPYKRIDIPIEAFNHWERPLWIVGDGPLRGRYKKLVKSDNIRFFGKVPAEELRRLYGQARAVIFPQAEDFGIVPLEAQACGTPVIAFGCGGALETVGEGVFFYEQTPEALREAVLRFESQSFDPEVLRRHALQFDKEQFRNRIRRSVTNAAR